MLVENILTAGDLEMVANRILQEMERPFDIFGHVVQAGASIGAAMAGPEHTALRTADPRRGLCHVSRQAGGRRALRNLRQASGGVRHQPAGAGARTALPALDKRLLRVPVSAHLTGLPDGRLEGFECLLRWRRADGSVESFRDLLAVAEETGLSITLGRETHGGRVLAVAELALTRLPHGAISILTVNLTRAAVLSPRSGCAVEEGACGQRRRSVAAACLKCRRAR